MNYYIYYRSAATAEELIARVEAMQTVLQGRTGVRGSLLRQAADAAMWMEIYNGVGDAEAFEKTLADLVAEHGMQALLQHGVQRKTEKFEPV